VALARGGLPIPDTSYARAGDAAVAYQVFGSGEHRVVAVPGAIGNVGLLWEWPPYHRFFERWGNFATVAQFDRRGTGASDRIERATSTEEGMEDFRVVMDAVGCALVVSFDERGLGNLNIDYTVTADATATYACINGGGNHPQAANKETVNDDVSGSGSFEPKNGRVVASLSGRADLGGRVLLSEWPAVGARRGLLLERRPHRHHERREHFGCECFEDVLRRLASKVRRGASPRLAHRAHARRGNGSRRA
jgi:hypothetical protein